MNRFLVTATVIVLAAVNVAYSQPTLDWAISEDLYSDDYYSFVEIDFEGNIFTCYKSEGFNPGQPPFVTKLSPAGDTLWRRSYGVDPEDRIRGMCLDDAGNVYLAMWVQGILDDRGQQGIVKYYSNGDPGFIFVSNPTGADAGANAVVIGAANEIYFCGTKWTGTTYGFFTGKLDTAGVLQWERLFEYDPGASAGSDHAYHIQYQDGKVYVVGQGKNGTETDSYDVVTVCYDTSGTEEWVNGYSGDGTNPNYEFASDMALDAYGNVYVAGISSKGYPATNQNQDFLLVKIDSVGQFGWDYKDGGQYDALYEMAVAVEVDYDGNIVAVGNMGSYSSGTNMQTVKFSPAGDTLWINYGYTAGGISDWGYDLIIDTENQVYLGGSYSDIVNLVCLSSDSGTVVWDKHYNGPGTYTDAVGSLAFGSNNSIYGAGSFGITADPLERDFALLKWILPPCCDLAGDLDNSGGVDIADLVYTVSFMFQGGPPPPCLDEGDMNADCVIDIADLVYQVDYMFLGGAAPVCGCVNGP